MRVGIVSTIVPFIKGGGRSIVEWTAEAMRERGHEVEEVYLPFLDSPWELMAQMAGLRALPLSGFDRVVTIRWPAHIVEHDNKVAWFIHHYRTLFDLWDTPLRCVADDPAGRALREAIRTADNRGLAECRAVYTNSQIVADRLARFNNVKGTPLYPPLGGVSEAIKPGPFGDSVVYVSRIVSHKRQLLAVEALARTNTPVKLEILGAAESPDYLASIKAVIKREGLADRVKLRAEWISDAEKAEALSNSLGVLYLPLDEDSYGYPSLEAAAAAKPIVVTSDGGGALEFVQHEISGLVAEPNPDDLAAAFDRLYADRQWAAQLGARAAARVSELGIDWDTVVNRLLGDA